MSSRRIPLTSSLTFSLCLFFWAVLFLAAWQATPRVALAQEGSNLSSDQIRKISEDVMDHNDFRRLRERDRNADEGFLSRLFKSLDDKSGQGNSDNGNGRSGSAVANSIAGGIGQLFMVIALLAVAVLIGLAIVLIVRSFEKRKRSTNMAGPPSPIEIENITSTPPGEIPTEQYRLRAEECARTGDYRGAVRQILLGCMSWIERSGQIHFRRGLTNRDYWRAVCRQEPRGLAFGSIAFEFEKVFFGRRQATAEMYQACLNHFLKEFHEQRAVATN